MIDNIRASTNKFWYEAVVNKCEGLPKAFSTETTTCTKLKAQQRSQFSELSQELQEKVFFDAVLGDMATKNQCEYEAIQAMSVTPRSSDSQFTRANAEILQFLGKDASALRVVPVGKASAKRMAKAQEAQKKLVSKYIEKARDIVDREKQLERLRAVRSDDPQFAQVIQLSREIENIKNSIPYGDKSAAQDFFKSIYDTLKYDRMQGAKTSPEELISRFTGTGDQSFQKQVVEKGLRNAIASQQDMAATKGNYTNQHGFKVKAFEEGHAERFLFGNAGTPEQLRNFAGMHCELQAKYGIGSEISSLSNNLVVGAATAGLGGGSFLLARLARVGVVSRRAEAIYSGISAGTNGTLSAAEFAHSIVTSCFDNAAGAAVYDSCKVQKDIETSGISEFADKEISNMDCVSSLGMAALSGVTAFKQAQRTRQLRFENQLEKAGVLDSYQKASSRIQSSDLPVGYKSKIDKELKTALKSVKADGAPNPQLMEALAQEDPDTLYSMLKQINEANPELSWAAKVRAWVKAKQVPSEEQLEIEACLIQTGSQKTTTCVPTKFISSGAGSAG